MTPARIVIAIWLVLVAAGPLYLPEFYITLVNYIGLYSLVALGLVLLTGIAGLTSFGQAAFVGVGAYATAVASTQFSTRASGSWLVTMSVMTATESAPAASTSGAR